jgi:hypothetical protein
MMHTSLSLHCIDVQCLDRHVSGITCPSSGSATWTLNWWLVGAVVDVGDQPTSTAAHNSHQFCVRVMRPEDGQVMPETCRYNERQIQCSESEVCIRLVVLIRNYICVSYMVCQEKFQYNAVPPF